MSKYSIRQRLKFKRSNETAPKTDIFYQKRGLRTVNPDRHRANCHHTKCVVLPACLGTVIERTKRCCLHAASDFQPSSSTAVCRPHLSSGLKLVASKFQFLLQPLDSDYHCNGYFASQMFCSTLLDFVSLALDASKFFTF